MKGPATGFALDLDAPGCCRAGKPEGARKGFNPRRTGRHRHPPLRAVLAEAPFILPGGLRRGNPGAARGVVPFLQAALALLPAGTWLRTVRAERGCFDGSFLDFLEERAWPWVVVARWTSTLKRKGAGIKEGTAIDAPHAAGAFTGAWFGGSSARRGGVVRERLRETKAAVGRKWRAGPGDPFRVWVTHRRAGARAVWRDDNGRACVEQRIEALKHALAADGFGLPPFFATAAAFLAGLCPFNLLSLYPHQTTPDAPDRQPGTLRVAVFLCGAVRGVMGRDGGVQRSAAWGGLRKHKPLVTATLDWRKCASPKLIPPEDRLAIGGGMI